MWSPGRSLFVRLYGIRKMTTSSLGRGQCWHTTGSGPPGWGRGGSNPACVPLKQLRSCKPQSGWCAPNQMGSLKIQTSSLRLFHCFKQHALLSCLSISMASQVHLTVAALSIFAGAEHSWPLSLHWRKHSPDHADNLVSVFAASLPQPPCLCRFLGHD